VSQVLGGVQFVREMSNENVRSTRRPRADEQRG
jgi:hypothetical protein